MRSLSRYSSLIPFFPLLPAEPDQTDKTQHTTPLLKTNVHLAQLGS